MAKYCDATCWISGAACIHTGTRRLSSSGITVNSVPENSTASTACEEVRAARARSSAP